MKTVFLGTITILTFQQCRVYFDLAPRNVGGTSGCHIPDIRPQLVLPDEYHLISGRGEHRRHMRIRPCFLAGAYGLPWGDLCDQRGADQPRRTKRRIRAP